MSQGKVKLTYSGSEGESVKNQEDDTSLYPTPLYKLRESVLLESTKYECYFNSKKVFQKITCQSSFNYYEF